MRADDGKGGELMKLIGLEPGRLYVLLLPEGDHGTAHRTATMFREETAGMDNPPKVVVLIGDAQVVGIDELPAAQQAAVVGALTAPVVPTPPLSSDWQSVKSSNIAAVRYDLTQHQLHVRFTNRSEYCYCDVPPEVFTSFLEADSKGQYFAKAIKGVYGFLRGGSEEVLR